MAWALVWALVWTRARVVAAARAAQVEAAVRSLQDRCASRMKALRGRIEEELSSAAAATAATAAIAAVGGSRKAEAGVVPAEKRYDR